MSTEHLFDEKGKGKARANRETAALQKKTQTKILNQKPDRVDPGTVAQMQQTVGNSAVQRFLVQREGTGPTELDDETASAINSQRGGGQTLEDSIADKAGQVMGQDFSQVKVHTDSQSDQLNRQVGAKAFTTGNDIFFREGAYNPGNEAGQRLIAHELTHVVQQGATTPNVQGKMTVNDPNDKYEAEADRVADTVMSAPVQRAEIPEEEAVQAQEMEEEESVQAQEMEEEEPIQAQEEEEELSET